MTKLTRSQSEAIVRAVVVFFSTIGVGSFSYMMLRRHVISELDNTMFREGLDKKKREQDRAAGRGGWFGNDITRNSPEVKKAVEEATGEEITKKPGSVEKVLKKLKDKKLTRKQQARLLCIAADETDILPPLLWTTPVVFVFVFLLILIMDLIIYGAVNRDRPVAEMARYAAIRAAVVAVIVTGMFVFIANVKRPALRRIVVLNSILLGFVAVGMDSLMETVLVAPKAE
jgi:hypothetical protein